MRNTNLGEQRCFLYIISWQKFIKNLIVFWTYSDDKGSTSFDFLGIGYNLIVCLIIWRKNYHWSSFVDQSDYTVLEFPTWKGFRMSVSCLFYLKCCFQRCSIRKSSSNYINVFF